MLLVAGGSQWESAQLFKVGRSLTGAGEQVETGRCTKFDVTIKKTCNTTIQYQSFLMATHT